MCDHGVLRINEQVSTHASEDDAWNEGVLIWVNGRLLPRAEAVVFVYNSGFMLGDGVWEGLRLYNGRWAFLDEHLDRLFEAAKAIDLDIGRDRASLAAVLEETRAANGVETEAHARLMVTRGVKSPPIPESRPVAPGPHYGDHHRAFAPEHSPPIRLATVPHLRGLPMTQTPKLNNHS
jgi:branched-chain amino acid aminotransferase